MYILLEKLLFFLFILIFQNFVHETTVINPGTINNGLNNLQKKGNYFTKYFAKSSRELTLYLYRRVKHVNKFACFS